jgi:hypothetical protein
MPFSIKECLRGYTADALGIMCDEWQLAATTKTSRIRALEKILQDGLHIADRVRRLEPEEQRLLAVAAEHGRPRVPGLTDVRGLYGGRDPKAMLLGLARQGLLLGCPLDSSGVFSFEHLTREYYAGEPAPRLMVPELVTREVEDLPTTEIALPPESAPPEKLGKPNPERATTELLEVLRIVEMVSPRLTAEGEMHRSDEARALELAREAGLTRESLDLSLAIARRLGCVEERNKRLATAPESERWAKLGLAERTRALLQGYLTSEELPDLRLFFPQLFRAMLENMPEGTLRRTYHKRLVMQVLAQLDPECWYSVPALVETVFREDSNVLFLEERWRAIKSNMGQQTPSWKQRAWQTHEARLFGWMLQTLFVNLGILESGDSGALVRVSALGRYALGDDDAELEETEFSGDEVLVVKPDFEMVVYLDRCPPELRRKLDAFADRANGGMVATYQLTQESIYRGTQTGTTVEAFIGLLETHGMRTLPGNVRDQLETWKRKLDALRVRRGCRLMECPDAAAADALVADLSGARRIGERYVLLNGEVPEHDAHVRYQGEPPACLQQEDGLHLRANWDDAHLFLRRHLDLIGAVREIHGDLLIELSQAQLKHADDGDDLVAQLQQLAQEPLAPRYRFALQSWTGEGGGAVAASVTVVRFDEPDTCDAILQLAPLADHVEGRLGLYTLVIKQAHLAKFKKALREQGIRVSRADTAVDTAGPETWAPEWVERHAPADDEAVSPKSTSSRKRGGAKTPDGALPSYSQRIMREIVEDAIERRRAILIEYRSTWSKHATVRRVNPVALDNTGSAPSMSGFCHQLGSARAFKLGQISGIRVLEDEPF